MDDLCIHELDPAYCSTCKGTVHAGPEGSRRRLEGRRIASGSGRTASEALRRGG